jgi:hypothetical protein
MEKKNEALREVRKLVDIVKTYGNTLVPALPGEKETSAQERLKHFTNYLINEEGMTIKEIEAEILTLD